MLIMYHEKGDCKLKILKIYLLTIWILITIGNFLQVLGNKDANEKIDTLIISIFTVLPTLFYIIKA